MNKEIEIPEGYEARIEGDKIVLEPKESEDERIRKAMINVFATHKDYEIFFGVSVEDILAYLEKYKESAWTEEDESFVTHILPRILNPYGWTSDQISADKKYLTEFIERQKRKFTKEQKPANNLKPKFKVGDRVNKNDREDEEYCILTINSVNIDEHCYVCNQCSVIDFEEQDLWHIVEQKPAEYEKSLLSKFEQAVYDCAWGKVTCKPEGETQEEYAKRWAEHLLLMARNWADDKGKTDAEKPAEWSEEDRIELDVVLNAVKELEAHGGNFDVSKNWLNSLPERFNLQPKQGWGEEDKNFIKELCDLLASIAKNNYVGRYYAPDLVNKLQSLHPQPKQESEPIEIKYAGKIYKVYGTKELPGGVVGYIIEDEPGHYDCIIHPDEALGGGYGIKSNGSPYPTKEANFGQPHWKPSEEQLEALDYAWLEFDDKGTCTALSSLISDLQKLM